ncbi:MAG: site-2 protease family protein [Halioglobus sp.]
MELLNTVALTLATLAVLVAIHEFGHFWVARRCGVQVLRFSIGFGPSLFSWHDRLGTQYSIAAIPLGGYVKMLDEREGEVPAAELHRAFNRKPPLQRIAVVSGVRWPTCCWPWSPTGVCSWRGVRLCADRRVG